VKRFSVKTLGCKLNQYETARISSGLIAAGWQLVDFADPADYVIVNTCTVTDNADRKCRNYIRQGAAKSGGRVVVTGCLAERSADSLMAMNEVDSVIGNAGKNGMVELLTGVAADTGSVAEGRTRAFLKIQDGCDGECAYCIVPAVRGLPRSRPWDEVIAEAAELIAAGYPEIVLTGVTIGKYADGGRGLADLARAIVSLPGAFRLRITSIEPVHCTDELVALFAHPKICPHIHLPLQSGSDRILSLMKRPYRAEEYRARVAALRAVRPEIAIGADVIVGFPGETDDDFRATMDLLAGIRPALVHQFTFSKRRGTPAAALASLPKAVLDARSAELKTAAAGWRRDFAAELCGTACDAVVEPEGSGFTALTGHYMRVALAGSDYTPGMRRVRIVGIADDGEVLSGCVV
jgi:threonylcarbamoyladenosine tRNA methylthiotransferase MtaB